VSVGYLFEEKVRGSSPHDAPTLEWEGKEKILDKV
jgi:hypothetical protein